MNPKVKNIIIFASIFILAIVAYAVFFGKKSSTPSLQTTAGAPAAAVSPVAGNGVGKEFLATLLNLRNIRLDDSIFKNPSFTSLQDFELSLIQEANPGRQNPFLPLGVDQEPAPPPAPAPTPPPTPTPPPSTP